ncbi:MAG: hypothetical protein D6680_17880 [Cyanobacteria bacterium J007]|nr:MAG: hypothetical protein D6680_17880 [Cyanobacteria bacterium J007]
MRGFPPIKLKQIEGETIAVRFNVGERRKCGGGSGEPFDSIGKKQGQILRCTATRDGGEVWEAIAGDGRGDLYSLVGDRAARGQGVGVVAGELSRVGRRADEGVVGNWGGRTGGTGLTIFKLSEGNKVEKATVESAPIDGCGDIGIIFKIKITVKVRTRIASFASSEGEEMLEAT